MGAEALIKQHLSWLKRDFVMNCFVIDEIQGPRLIGLIINMNDAAHHMGIHTIAMHVQPGARAIAADPIGPAAL